MSNLSLDDVMLAQSRLKNYIVPTPLISSDFLNERLNCQIFFKLEAKQKTGSFKVRGAFNHLIALKEQNRLPKRVVAVSSGNHAQAVAYACKNFDIPALIYTSKITSPLKIQATLSQGAEVVITEKRSEANYLTDQRVKEGYHLIHPSDDDLVIAGQGTACLEALQEIEGGVDAIFMPCGGGGLASGCYLASEGLKNKVQLFAVEPELGNDATLSVANGVIHSLEDSPNTIADGARTLSISNRTFDFLKKMAAMLTVSEQEIIYATQWLHYLLKITAEPTSALGLAGCLSWIRRNNISGQKILIILSGGNISAATYRQVWEQDYLGGLAQFPAIVEYRANRGS